ncbi:MAG: hypothetical protein ACFE9S_07140 [Candidatus Hermodarchaeota archaeon]
MRVRLFIEWDILNKLEDVGADLKIFTKDKNKPISELCDKTAELYRDFNNLLESLLPFLEKHHFDQSDIAKLCLTMYKRHFKSKLE